MESYSSGRRGAPAKGVGVEMRARVQIPHSPPKENPSEPVMVWVDFSLQKFFLSPFSNTFGTLQNGTSRCS